MPHIQEINFDGLVGPTHNFAGLAYGNIASNTNAHQKSYPKHAALQGLKKMANLMRLGIPQGIFPPHERPHIPTLRSLGFTQAPEVVIPTLAKTNPKLLTQVCSASPMWVANAGTTSHASDTTNGKTHFTPANLSSMFHRSIEHEFTGRIFQTLFSDSQYFTHHKALPSTVFFGDEGAANHTRFCSSSGQHGLNLFVFGQSFLQNTPRPKLYPARQSLEASQAIARLHGLTPEHTIFTQQNPNVIDQGVFHNDVIAVGSRNILLCHEQAFLEQKHMLHTLKQLQESRTDETFYIIEAKNNQVSVEDAVQTYLFNTQLVFPKKDSALLIAPIECASNKRVKTFLDQVIADNNPIDDVQYFDLRQSMKNGGGPACLRFRVTLSHNAINNLQTNTLLTEDLYTHLQHWIEKHYQDELSFNDLANPLLYQTNLQALDELTQILNLGADFYDFQKI